MSRPIFVPDSAPTVFADYMQACTDAVTRVLRTGDVPEPALFSVAEHRMSVTPWHPGAPLSGLLAWSEYLTDAQWSATVHHLESGRPLVSIYVTGTLDSIPAELVGGSWRTIPGVDVDAAPGVRQPLDPEAVRTLALDEQPIRDIL